MQITSIISMLLLPAMSCLAVPVAIPASGPVTQPEEGLLGKPRAFKADRGIEKDLVPVPPTSPDEIEQGLAMPRTPTSQDGIEASLLAKPREIEEGFVEAGLLE